MSILSMDGSSLEVDPPLALVVPRPRAVVKKVRLRDGFLLEKLACTFDKHLGIV